MARCLGFSFALVWLLGCSVFRTTHAARHQADAEATKMMSMEVKADHFEVSHIDENGFCPEIIFGGGKGSHEPTRLKDDMVMVKTLWAEHLPSGGGFFSEDIPDTYIKFSMGDSPAQSSFVKNTWTPFFGTTCFFRKGTGWLKMELFEYDSGTFSGSETKVGEIGASSDGLQLIDHQCNVGLIYPVDGECSYKMFVWDKGEKVKGKDGEFTTVTIAVKFINSARKYNFALPSGLMEMTESQKVGSSITEGQEVGLTTQMDENGYCPTMSIGGGKGSAQAKAPPAAAVSVKILGVQNLPEGGWGDREPDPYVIFSFAKKSGHEGKDLFHAELVSEGQTQAFHDKLEAVYMFECTFATNSPAAEALLYIQVWDWDTGKDDLIGVLEVPVSKMKCNHGAPSVPPGFDAPPAYPTGECAFTMELNTKEKQRVAPTVTVSFKFIDVMPRGVIPAPLNLGL